MCLENVLVSETVDSYTTHDGVVSINFKSGKSLTIKPVIDHQMVCTDFNGALEVGEKIESIKFSEKVLTYPVPYENFLVFAREALVKTDKTNHVWAWEKTNSSFTFEVN